MPNIIEVARQAGVSKTLVSRVLNGQSGVGPENRERILEAMSLLNYRPNILARSLVLKRTQAIGVVMDSLCVSYYFGFIGAVTRSAEAMGYHLVFGSLPRIETLRADYLAYFTQGYADGVILYGSTVENEGLISYLVDARFPVVVVEHNPTNEKVHRVLLDNHGGAYTAVKHLTSRGCQDIRHFVGDLDKQVTQDRLAGYQHAMRDLGLTIKEHSVVQASFTEAAGYDAMRRLIEAGDVPQAIFCGSDLTAFGAMRAAMQAGIRIPEEIKFVGFDDDKPESHDIVFPQLTTLRQPLDEMGRLAIEQLVKAIRDPDIHPLRSVLSPELVLRETT